MYTEWLFNVAEAWLALKMTQLRGFVCDAKLVRCKIKIKWYNAKIAWYDLQIGQRRR